VNGYSSGNQSPSTFSVRSFSSPSVLGAQVLIQSASGFHILIHVLINGFVADHWHAVYLAPSADLFGRPLFVTHLFNNKLFHFGIEKAVMRFVFFTVVGVQLGKGGIISSLGRTVTPQFSADGAFVDTDSLGNIAVGKFRFF
jgi:hypothetical protein